MPARGGFLAEADKGGAQQGLQFGLALFGHLRAQFAKGRLKRPAAHAAIQRGELADSDGGLAPRVQSFTADTTGVLQEDPFGGGAVAAVEQFLGELLDVARGNAPRVGRKQDAALAGFWHGGPELPVKNVAVRFDGGSGAGHLVFAHLQELAQGLDLLAHALEQLADGIDANLSTLVAVHCKTNGEILRELQQDGLIRTHGASNSRQGLPQRCLRGLG